MKVFRVIVTTDQKGVAKITHTPHRPMVEMK